MYAYKLNHNIDLCQIHMHPWINLFNIQQMLWFKWLPLRSLQVTYTCTAYEGEQVISQCLHQSTT